MVARHTILARIPVAAPVLGIEQGKLRQEGGGRPWGVLVPASTPMANETFEAPNRRFNVVAGVLMVTVAVISGFLNGRWVHAVGLVAIGTAFVLRGSPNFHPAQSSAAERGADRDGVSHANAAEHRRNRRRWDLLSDPVPH